MSKPLVSVVIATYNSGPYLREAMDSVLQQSVDDLELVVIDDGSTDSTPELVASFTDPRISYFRQDNAGQTAAKNHGIRRARGEFIGFCDGDDYWYRNKLELQLPLLNRSARVGVVYSAADAVDPQGKPLGHTLPAPHRGAVTAQLFMRNFVPFGTSVIRRECIERLGAFDSSQRMGIDWDLWLRISTQYEFDCVAQSTYAYRIWSGQMSKNWRGRYSSAFRIMENFVRAYPQAVPARLRRKAIADTYATRGRARSHEMPLRAISDGVRGVVLDPLEPYMWATLVRLTKDALIPSARPSSAQTFTSAGGNYPRYKRLLGRSTALLTASHPRIFMYHRFSRETRLRAMQMDAFRQQMSLLKARCDIVTLAELCEKGRRLDRIRPQAVITVDDGYADFFEVGFPVLHELGLRATVFVTTGFIDGQLYLWPDRMRALLETAPTGTYSLSGKWEGQQVQLRTADEREEAWNRLADQLVFRRESEREQALTDLADSLGMRADSLDMTPYKAMTWAQLRELTEAGFEIADHSHGHGNLPLMSDEEIRSDLSQSRSLLETKLGIRVRSFAYPNGTKKDYDARLVGLLQHLGYENAVLSVPAPADPRRRFEVGRFAGDCAMERFRSVVDGFAILRALV